MHGDTGKYGDIDRIKSNELLCSSVGLAVVVRDYVLLIQGYA
jgi:hypothetical protein